VAASGVSDGDITGGPASAAPSISSTSSGVTDRQLCGKYETAHPIWDGYDPNALDILAGRRRRWTERSLGGRLPAGGYLSTFFPGGVPRVPNSGHQLQRRLVQTYGAGLRFQYDAGNEARLRRP